MRPLSLILLALLSMPSAVAQIPGAQPFGDYPTKEKEAEARATLERIEKRAQAWKIGTFDVFQGDKYKGLVTFDSSDEAVASVEKIPLDATTKSTPLFWYKAVRLGDTELKRHIFQPQAGPYWIIEALKQGTTTITVWANGTDGPIKIDKFTIQVGDAIPPPATLSITRISPSDIFSGDLMIVSGTGFTTDAKVTYAGVTLLSTVNSSTVIQVSAPTVTSITLQPLVISCNGQQATQMLLVSPKPIVVPPPPIDKLGFVAFASTEGAKVASSRNLAVALAANFDEIAKKLEDSLTTAKPMTEAEGTAILSAKNKATLGDARPAWLPWFVAWAAKADKHNADGTMSTIQDIITAYRETATGLKMVK